MANETVVRSRLARLRPSRWLVVAGAMAVGGAVALPYLREYLSDKLTDYWQRRLLEAGDGQATFVARRVARLGPPGMAILVAGLASPQAAVAEAARGVLLEETASWTSAPADESAASALVLAEALAQHTARLGPAAQLLASDLSQRLLARPFDADAARQNRLTAACEAVLRETAAARRLLENPSREVPAARPGQDDAQAAELTDLDRVGDLPGVGLLPPANDEGQLVQTPGAAEGSPTKGTRRRRQDGSGLRWQAGASPSDAADATTEDEEVTDEARSRSLDAAAAAAESRSTNPASLPDAAPLRVAPLEISAPGAPDESPLPQEPADPPVDDTLTIMRRLHEPQPAVAQAAVEELRRRGFGVAELNLARRLAHPDAQRRRAFARSLAQPAGFDRRPWLYWLLDDADADVRWEAFSLLATTGDPQVLQELEQRARKDADPRIRREIDRLQKQRTAGGSGPRR